MPSQPVPGHQRRLRFLSFVVMLAIPIAMSWQVAVGADGDDPMFSASAFGTFGLVHSNDTNADFTTTILKPNGAGYSDAWDMNVDSIIGGQLTANFTPQLSAVVQVISQQGANNSYQPVVEWANLKWAFTPDFSLRVGRIVLPFFLVSDDRNVGYANPWVRPPVEVYGLVPITESDGADATYKLHLGDVIHTLTATYGQTEPALATGGTAKARQLWSVSDSIEYGPAALHATYLQSHLTVDYFDALFDSFRQFGPQGSALADAYDTQDKLATFMGVGGSYDPGHWFVTAEWGERDFRSILGRSTGWYVSGGWRVAQFTPYVTYAALAAHSRTSDPGLTLAQLPPAAAAEGAALNAFLNEVLGGIAVQNTMSAGIRWDFYKNLDLKVQEDYTRLGANSPGVLINLQPNFQRGSTLNLFSIAIDFVL
jgi:predicted porin